MNKKEINLPITYLKEDYWSEYGKISLTTINTDCENPYFNNNDIGFSVFFNDEVNVTNFLYDKHFYHISAPHDPNFLSYLMKLTDSEDNYIFSPTSSFNNMKPIVISKKDGNINKIVIAKLLLTFHDFDDSFKFIEEGD